MSDENQMRSVADSWIVVVTIFLALELGLITFTLDFFLEMNSISTTYLAVAGITVSLTGFSMIIFLAAKDPRMKAYPVPVLIDRGVLSVYLSHMSASITIALGLYLMTEQSSVAIILFFMLTGVASTMYFVFYRKLLHGKTLED